MKTYSHRTTDHVGRSRCSSPATRLLLFIFRCSSSSANRPMLIFFLHLPTHTSSVVHRPFLVFCCSSSAALFSSAHHPMFIFRCASSVVHLPLLVFCCSSSLLIFRCSSSHCSSAFSAPIIPVNQYFRDRASLFSSSEVDIFVFQNICVKCYISSGCS